MRETQSEQRARQIAALELQALQDELYPELANHQRLVDDYVWRAQALGHHLYNRPIPVSDAAMLALGVTTFVLTIVLAVTAVASAISHATTFRLFGWNLPSSVLVGFFLTGIVAGGGYLLFDNLLVRHRLAQGLIATLCFVLSIWGVIELSQARGQMTTVESVALVEQSYVDEPNTPESIEDRATDPATKETVRRLLSNGLVKIMIGSDFAVGLLLGLLASIRTSDDFAAWRHLKRLKARTLALEAALSHVAAIQPAAAKNCLAGILRGAHHESARSQPYFRLIPIVVFCVLSVSTVSTAQVTAQRHEAILLDVSGSIARKGQAQVQLKSYLAGTKRLLMTEPPSSRVWVQLITTDSFGGAQTILTGWTPAVQGVFTDSLESARRQLVRGLEAKVLGLTPSATGTDIVGALWRTKALLESGASNSRPLPTDIYLFSDMVADVPGFAMPALVPLGADRMFDMARDASLVVPLRGYRVHVYGASTVALSPAAWNTIRAFWQLYFREAEAELVTYSSETLIAR